MAPQLSCTIACIVGSHSANGAVPRLTASRPLEGVQDEVEAGFELAAVLMARRHDVPAGHLGEVGILPVRHLLGDFPRDLGRLFRGAERQARFLQREPVDVAVQLAKVFGAEVTGVCSTAKADLVRAIGADHVLDYSRADFADGRERYDLILDIGGNTPLARLRRALTPRGTLVIAGGEGARWTGIGRQLRALVLSLVIRQRLTMFVSRPRRADLDTLRRLTEARQVTPVIDGTCPLTEVPQAIRRLHAGQVRGKLVITL
jgi:Zinc-binding dehydrogenase